MQHKSSKMKTYVIIPARYASTRFPGKPLVKINGKPMIQHVYEAALTSEADEVMVATDDDRIRQCVESFGGKAVMTSPLHPSGTDRCGEVAENLQMDNDDVIINIQGDEPFITKDEINTLAKLFTQADIQIATLIKEIDNLEEINDPNKVKVVISKQNKAIYFSRFPIPYVRNAEATLTIHYKHIGIYAYRKQTLKQLIRLPESNLEKAEKLEQLRWIENGYHIYTAECNYEGIGIDTPNDLLKINHQ